ncbi:MAG TPA: ATP-binding protein [Burkholderiaceae bacterium]|nr:ATP-binding protein [Burkholderiaceae bacterium]
MSTPSASEQLQQALAELAAERKRSRRLQERLHALASELEVTKGAVHDASTSRLLAEEALDDTRGRLALALDAAQLGLWEIGVDDGRTYVNARWSEMVGDIAIDSEYPFETLMERIHPEDITSVRQHVEDAVKGRQLRYVTQFRIRTFDDQWLWMESHGMGVDLDPFGRPARLVGVSADITHRKQLEHATEQARQAAEAASQSKTEFLANVSHEVRTPLNGVMGLIRLLMDSSLTDEQRQWLMLMDDSAQTLLHLLNDILDLSKIEAGRMDLESTAFDLNAEVNLACGPFSAQASAKDIAFQVEHQTTPGQPVHGDPGKLRQVLVNLLSNAVKFTPAGGQIHVRVQPSAQGIHFEVQDTGIGIAPEQQQRVFEAFTQADASTTRKYGGTGLGLAISARLVSLMGGRLQLDSAPGQGSRFHFVLPLRAQTKSPVTDMGPLSAPLELEHLSQRAQSFSALRVLVAEDHPINELLMRELLKKLGCQTTVARNGLEAVAAWKRGGIDLILMDVQMPELNGLDATREIRALEASGFQPPHTTRQHTPIVAVTANAMSGDRDLCETVGMDTYVSKPVGPQALTQAMTEALTRLPPQATANLLAFPVPSPSGPHATALREGTKPATPPLNLDKLRHRLEGNEQALIKLAQNTRQQLGQHEKALISALAQQDVTLARQHAHALKTTLATLTADRASALCNGLETAAHKQEWTLFGRALPVLQAELARLNQVLSGLAP